MEGPLVDELWQTGPEDRPGALVRILPDGGLDLIWTGDGLIIAGPDRAARTVTLAAGPPMCGVRFLPGASRAVFGVGGDALVDETVPAADVLGQTVVDVLGQRLDAAPVAARPRILAQWATSDARATDARDPVVAFAARALAGPEQPSVADLAEKTGYSERQLRRRMTAEVGYSPKRLARILRLRRATALAKQQPALSLADVALAAGYADQAHLGHESSALGGTTAAVLLER